MIIVRWLDTVKKNLSLQELLGQKNEKHKTDKTAETESGCKEFNFI